MQDSKLLVAVARNRKVRIIVANTTKIVEDARLTHDLYPTSNATLGRVLSIGALMSSMLKREDEKINIQINGGGPIGTVMTEVNGSGKIKGFVGDNTIYLKYNENNKLAVGVAVGTDGYLKVNKNMGLKNIFSSQVALQSGEIGDDFAYYFTVSEQVPSLVSVGVLVDTNYSTKAAGGLIIQLLPNHSEEDILYIEELQNKMQPISSMIDKGMELEEIVKSMFDDCEVLDIRNIYYECDCSKERFMSAILTLPKDDLQELLKDEIVEVKCEYCNKKYQIKHDDMLNFINENK